MEKDSLLCKPLLDTISNKEYYFSVDSMPEFPGGINKLFEFFMANFNYPQESYVCCKIIVQFTVDTFGKMTEIKILRGLQSDFDNETIRVFNMMPNWAPGKCKGIAVPVRMIIPINFNIQ